MQLHGGNGYTTERRVERYWRRAARPRSSRARARSSAGSSATGCCPGRRPDRSCGESSTGLPPGVLRLPQDSVLPGGPGAASRKPCRRPISDYALIGGTHSCALIARDGSIDWLCWPRPRFAGPVRWLLDDDTGGSCSAFDGPTEAVRRYLPDTNILETTFTTATGRARLVDLMPVNPPSPEPDEGGWRERRPADPAAHLRAGPGDGRVRVAAGRLRLCATPLHAPDGGRVRPVRAGDWRLRVGAQPCPHSLDGDAPKCGSACRPERPPIWS